MSNVILEKRYNLSFRSVNCFMLRRVFGAAVINAYLFCNARYM